jgi:hypothetical protein
VTVTEPIERTDRVTAAYDAIVAFQRKANLSSLRLAQIRMNLAEHLADTLLAPAAVPAGLAPATDRAAVLLWAADQIDAETRQAKADGVLEPDKYRPCRDASAQLRRLAGEAQQDEAHAWQQEWDSRPNGADVSDLVEITPARETQQDPAQDGEALPSSIVPLASGLPLVQGNCPACRGASLFLGDGGYVTCSRIDCPEPDAATTVLERPAVVARSGQPDTGEETLVHVGWWCWRGDNHGHLTTMACRSDNVPIHVPAEWADDMRAVIQRIEDGDAEPGRD